MKLFMNKKRCRSLYCGFIWNNKKRRSDQSSNDIGRLKSWLSHASQPCHVILVLRCCKILNGSWEMSWNWSIMSSVCECVSVILCVSSSPLSSRGRVLWGVRLKSHFLPVRVSPPVAALVPSNRGAQTLGLHAGIIGCNCLHFLICHTLWCPLIVVLLIPPAASDPLFHILLLSVHILWWIVRSFTLGELLL